MTHFIRWTGAIGMALLSGCASWQHDDSFEISAKEELAMMIAKAQAPKPASSPLHEVRFIYNIPLHAPAGYIITNVNEALRWHILSTLPYNAAANDFVQINPGEYTALQVLKEVGNQVPWVLSVDERAKIIKLKPLMPVNISVQTAGSNTYVPMRESMIRVGGFKEKSTADRVLAKAEDLLGRSGDIKVERHGKMVLYVVLFESNDPQHDVHDLKKHGFKNARIVEG
jgi:hypothetical protein